MPEGSCSADASVGALTAVSANTIFTAVVEDVAASKVEAAADVAEDVVALTAVSANLISTAFAEDVVTWTAVSANAFAEEVATSTANPMSNTCCQDLSMANSR